MKHRVVACIPTKDTGWLLKKTLKHLSSFCHKIIISDDSGTDNTEEICSEHEEIEYYRRPERPVGDRQGALQRQELLDRAYKYDPDYFLFLDATDAKGNADNVFNDTAPSSSVITLGNAGDTNANTQTYVAYLWTDIQGFSKFGIYTGNGNADGPFIHTGFSPSFVMTHNTETASQWTMWDNKRTANSNLKDEVLYANGTNAEATAATESVDFLSNGFKIRGNNSGINTSGEIYIYMAFAEAPFVNSKGAPANAR